MQILNNVNGHKILSIQVHHYVKSSVGIQRLVEPASRLTLHLFNMKKQYKGYAGKIYTQTIILILSLNII